ncbi:MAG: nuclease A inhibitor family protein [Myxococcota bacterium]
MAKRLETLIDGTPEADGVIAMLNSESTTFDLLDGEVGLDRRAAQNLVARREGPQGRFQTVHDLDAVPWVGEAALQRLLDYARRAGWVRIQFRYGRVEGVDFTTFQAWATVQLANEGSRQVLDEQVPLDRRAAGALVNGRPFATVEEVAQAFYVGPAGLAALRDFAERWSGPGLLSTDAAQAVLGDATVGLVHVSDIDERLTVVTIRGVASINSDSAEQVLAGVYVPRAGEATLADRVVEEVTLARYFDGYTVEDPFWDDDHRAAARRWRLLRAIVEEQLIASTVLRLGEYAVGPGVGGGIDIFVLGTTTDGDLTGFATISVEP